MDKETAIGICMDRINRWTARVQDLLNGTANPDKVAMLANEEDAGSSVAMQLPTTKLRKPGKSSSASIDLDTADRDELVDYCRDHCNYTSTDVKAKRIQTLRGMITDYWEAHGKPQSNGAPKKMKLRLPGGKPKKPSLRLG